MAHDPAAADAPGEDAPAGGVREDALAEGLPPRGPAETSEPLALAWQLTDQGQGGGQARLLESDGHFAVVESTLPFAAGATLIATDPVTNTEYRIKVRGGRRLDANGFRIEGRFVSLTRPERARLLAELEARSRK